MCAKKHLLIFCLCATSLRVPPAPPKAQKWAQFVSRRYKNEQMFKNHNLTKTIIKTLLLLNSREYVLIWKFSVDVKLPVTRKINKT